MLRLLIICLAFPPYSFIQIKIDTRRVIHVVDERFASVTVDTGIMSRHWSKFEPSSDKVKTLAKALSPSYLRFGGTEADLLVFGEENRGHGQKNKYPFQMGTEDSWLSTENVSYYPKMGIRSKRDIGYTAPEERYEKFKMTAELYGELISFVDAAGFKLIFDLNSLLRIGEKWNTTNAYELLEYTVKKSYPIAGWELGNEPNAYYHQFGIRVEPEQRAKDYIKLKQMVSNFTALENGIIIGPSVTQLSKKRSVEYFESFLRSGGGDVVTAATFHQYYVNARTATLDEFTDPNVLNGLIEEISRGSSITNKTTKHGQLWLGETSSAWGGGAEGLSDRYVAGFMWLDKLGVSSKFGVDVVVRQAFYGGHYSLLDSVTRDPNPDYWLTLLYKKLVGRRVLDIIAPDFRGKLRVYAHCANTQRTGYQPGSIVIYALNLNSESVNLTFQSLVSDSSNIHVYLLQPADGDILSSTVQLNGTPLKMLSDTQLPTLLPRKQNAPVFLPKYTFGFVVLPDVRLQICL